MAGSDHDVGRALSSPRVGRVQGLILPCPDPHVKHHRQMFHVKHDSPDFRAIGTIATIRSRPGWCRDLGPGCRPRHPPAAPRPLAWATAGGHPAPRHRVVTREPSFPVGLLVGQHPGGPVEDGSGPSPTTRESRWNTSVGTATPAGRLSLATRSAVADLGEGWTAVPEQCLPTRGSGCHHAPGTLTLSPGRPAPTSPAARGAVTDRAPPHRSATRGVPALATSIGRVTAGPLSVPPSGSSTRTTLPSERRRSSTGTAEVSGIPAADHHQDARGPSVSGSEPRRGVHLAPSDPTPGLVGPDGTVPERASPSRSGSPSHRRPPVVAGARVRAETNGPNPRQCFT